MKPTPEEADVLLRVRGIMPPDEFQPFVKHVASRFHVRGWVRNDSYGALIRAVASEDELVGFVHALRCQAPPATRVRGIETEPLELATVAATDTFVSLPAEN